ncbi:hypothetical protein ACWT_3938 [Actinoplanes sp. SE50]|uniref:DUF4440 domain-containing protein n=1 Tax=unclassified Actinoplanes TaxID=2626549 RepID=UPI00023ED258|nr:MULTISPECIES: DUF4440 domain-containing protein [unclassified Actinoplanes]AEV84962.1 hypothetical protein ACPL_4067 [Actinoplanes sp. SE50/110]ATO83353.1 hypothetical protein ACWT_3938 [Actinoplanes sp. SE50]SLM00760.1 hypothetical protein ACSP50_3993 [Actinoplanes sp. SE50/110]
MPDTDADHAELTTLVQIFFDAFVSGPESPARLDTLRTVLLPEAVIARTTPELAVYTVDSFIEPRRTLLTSGRLTDFHEWPGSGHTEVIGDLAQHRCAYAKSGILDGTPFTAEGTKTFQFVRTPAGWRILAVAWQDH